MISAGPLFFYLAFGFSFLLRASERAFFRKWSARCIVFCAGWTFLIGAASLVSEALSLLILLPSLMLLPTLLGLSGGVWFGCSVKLLGGQGRTVSAVMVAGAAILLPVFVIYALIDWVSGA
ncbi:MAG: hypothetical protein AAGC81_13710 [Pseudomonadota bacterium]